MLRLRKVTYFGCSYSQQTSTDMTTLLYINRRESWIGSSSYRGATMRYEYHNIVMLSELNKTNIMRRTILWQRTGNISDSCR